MIQEQYWKEIYQLKSHINFTELQMEKSEKLDRGIKIILAISSSSSIGAWAIWHQFSWLWALIIAISQVVSAINPFLPYKNRIKTYSSLLIDLEQLMLKAEYKWHDISEGLLTSSEINRLRFEIRKNKISALNKYIKTSIPTNSKMQQKAENSAREYFQIFIHKMEIFMSKEKDRPTFHTNDPKPLSEEKGLQPAQNPPKMPEVKPAKPEKK